MIGRVSTPLVAVVALLASGCCPLLGSSSSSSGSSTSATPTAPAPPPPRFTPLMTPENLPPPLRALRFGDSTVSHVKGHFTLPTHYVTEQRDRSFGGDRDVEHPVGRNKGIKVVRVGVTRTQSNGVYIGPLGDDYGSISFLFGTLPNRPEPVLLELEVSQPLTASPSICDGVRALAANPAATTCPEGEVYRPSNTADTLFACGGDEEGQLHMTWRCAESTFLRQRTLTFITVASSALPTLAAPAPLPPGPGGAVGAVAPPVPPPVPPPVAPPVPPPVAPPVPPPVAVPTPPVMPAMPPGVPGAIPLSGASAAGVIPDEPGLSRNAGGGIDCRSGTHSLSGITIDSGSEDALWIAGDCNFTCTGCTLSGEDDVVDVGGNTHLTLTGCTVTARGGEALSIGGYAQVTVTGSQLSGRPAMSIGGYAQLSTMGTTYRGGTSRGGEARIQNLGGNSGMR